MERVIKANPDKCGVVIKNETPTMKKKIMKSNGILTTQNIYFEIIFIRTTFLYDTKEWSQIWLNPIMRENLHIAEKSLSHPSGHV